ncbi:unnamed protein product, partial [Diplocarpon coronariae]
ETEM